MTYVKKNSKKPEKSDLHEKLLRDWNVQYGGKRGGSMSLCAEGYIPDWHRVGENAERPDWNYKLAVDHKG